MDFIVNTVHEFNFFFFYLRASHKSTGWGYNPSFPTFSHQKPNLASSELSDNLLFGDLNWSKENWTNYPLVSTLLFYSQTCAFLQSPSKSLSRFTVEC